MTRSNPFPGPSTSPQDRTARRRGRDVLVLGWSTLVLAAGILTLEILAAGGSRPPLLDRLALGASAAVLTLVVSLLAKRYRYRPRAPRRSLPADGRLTKRPLDYLVSLLNVTRAVANEAGASDVEQVIVESCMDCFDCEEASLMRVDRGTGDLVVSAFTGHRHPSLVRGARVRWGEGVSGTVAARRTPLILGEEVDARRFPAFQPKARRIHCAMVAPVVVRNQVVGVLNVSTGNDAVEYTEDDLRVLCILAEHAGIVAAKARDEERVLRLIRRIRRRNASPRLPGSREGEPAPRAPRGGPPTPPAGPSPSGAAVPWR